MFVSFRIRFTRLVLPCLVLNGGFCLAADESGVLEEITVTAQKVTENLRNVPISISVVKGAQLADQHISDTEDLTRAVPNFSFSSNGNPGSNVLEIRGISSTAGASTVGIYLDDVAITQRTRGNYNVAQPEPYLLDIDQIEVLRGPQGTLYGASSEGGLIKFRTNPVDLTQLGGSASAGLSSTEHGDGPNYDVSAVINVPLITDKLGVRLGAATSYDAGYINRYSQDTGERVAAGINDHRTDVVRLGVEARPVDGLVIKPTLFYQRLTYGSSDTVTVALGPDSTNGRVRDSGSDTMIVPSITMQYDLGWSDLTSVTSDYTRNAPFVFDGTEFNSVYIGACFLDGQCGTPAVPDLQGNLSGARISALPAPAVDEMFERQVSEELRLASRPYTGSGVPLSWVGGLYFVDSRSRSDDYEYISNFNETFTALYGPANLNAIFGGPLPNEVIYEATKRFSEKQYSAFGDLSYYPTTALRISVGARYLVAHQSFDRTAYGFLNGGPSANSESSRDHALTPRFTANYEVTPQTSVYTTISKGFRLGAPNPPVPTQFCSGDLANLGMSAAPNAYVHEDLRNYEVGVKTRPDSRASLDMSAFYISWDHLQQYFVLPTCGFTFSTNVGSARSYGGELQLSIRPVDSLTLQVAGGYTNATLTQAVAVLGIQQGTPVEGVPRWNGTVSGDYEHALNASLTGFVRLNYNYTGSSHGALLTTDADYNRPDYSLVGGSIGIIRSDWQVQLYAKNLFNDRKIIQTPDHATLPVGYPLAPRTIGLSFSGRF